MNTQWAHAAIFRRTRRGPLPQEVADHLRRRIVSGDLRTGSRLPSLRALAGLFGVSLPTMHAAMHVLVGLGFVRVQQGVGTFVSRPRDEAAVLDFAWLQASPTELVAMRSVLDERFAHAAAQLVEAASPNRMPGTLDAIHLFAHDRAGERHNYPEYFLRADARLHRAIGASLRGYEIAAALRERIDTRLRDAFMTVADVLADDDALQDQHVALATAVLDGRPMEARRPERQIAAREAAALGDTLG